MREAGGMKIPVRSLSDLINFLHQEFFILYTDKAVHFFSVPEKYQRRDTPDLVFLCSA